MALAYDPDPKDVALALLLEWCPTGLVESQRFTGVSPDTDDWCRPTKDGEDPNFGRSDDKVWALRGFAYGKLKDVLAHDLGQEYTR
jgi:hypothetical protein